MITLLVVAVAWAQSAQETLQQADRYADQGDWFHAGPLYATAEEQFRATGDRRNELYAKLGRLHRQAESGAYRTVRDEINGLLSDSAVMSDHALHIRALSILGTINLNLDTEAAERNWNEVIRLATENNDPKWQNRGRGQLALIAGVHGDVGGSGLALVQAMQRAVAIGDTAGALHFAIWLANGLTMNGMPDRALDLLDKAVLFSKNANRETPLQLSVAKVRALATAVQAGSGQRAQFESAAQSTLEEARRKQTPGAEIEILNLWAKMLSETASRSQAERLGVEALAAAQRASLPRSEAQALLVLSQVYRQTGRLADADRHISKAVATLRQVEEPYDLPRFLAEQAEVKAAQGDLSQADALYSQALDVIEGLLVNAPSSTTKSAMIAARGDIYIGHFRLALERLQRPERAFTILEAARGRALYDSIRYSRTAISAVGNTAIEREITQHQRALLNNALSPSEAKRVLGLLDAAYDRLLPIEYARARAEMTLLRGKPAEPGEVRKRLQPGEVLVMYLLDAKQSYGLRLTRTGLTVHQLPRRQEFSNLARQFVEAVKAKQDPGQSAHSLYRIVVAPFVASDTKALTIVPDGPLHLVPFASLVDETGAALVAKLAITSAPSATVYQTLKTPRRSRASRPLLAISFSPNQRPQNTESGTRSVFDVRGPTLAPLPFGNEEVEEAARALGKGSITLSGPEASEAALKAASIHSFKVIHVAAHGVSNEREPDRAAIVLAAGNRAEDGLWQAREIRATRLNADVVVLSACETGTGRLQGQEGVMNLARAFLTAGAKSVVASLWSVDDRSTATLMGMFYEHLARGLMVREALRQAQLQFVKTYGAKATPYHWAGFEVIGDGTQRITNGTAAAN
ncbi:MAG: CHAT domain-containing protein [Bryobacterales bacterium]|nr:CHAT domain-containing protein [Bryobacterales bacterium]